MTGNVEEVEEILRNNPNLDVNWSDENENRSTALDIACDRGHDSIVSILLTHPGIDVNLKENGGWTPFNSACINGSTSCVRLLLKDCRVMVNEPTYDGSTPLYGACFMGHHDIIRWWITSEREMDLGEPGQWQSDTIGVAKKYGKTEVVALLERFKENPERTRYQVRLELGLADEVAAEIFAMVVFVSDGLLQVTQRNQSTTAAAKFFSIVSRLPLELQIMLCYRLVGSSKEIIHGKDSEMAFKELAKRILN